MLFCFLVNVWCVNKKKYLSMSVPRYFNDWSCSSRSPRMLSNWKRDGIITFQLLPPQHNSFVLVTFGSREFSLNAVTRLLTVCWYWHSASELVMWATRAMSSAYFGRRVLKTSLLGLKPSTSTHHGLSCKTYIPIKPVLGVPESLKGSAARFGCF